MSRWHRLRRGVDMLNKDPDANWNYYSYRDDRQTYFVFEDERTAQVVRDAIWLMFRANRKPLIHNGRKP
jgi:hypothetical protein